jgi:hypothetical protein
VNCIQGELIANWIGDGRAIVVEFPRLGVALVAEVHTRDSARLIAWSDDQFATSRPASGTVFGGFQGHGLVIEAARSFSSNGQEKSRARSVATQVRSWV